MNFTTCFDKHLKSTKQFFVCSFAYPVAKLNPATPNVYRSAISEYVPGSTLKSNFCIISFNSGVSYWYITTPLPRLSHSNIQLYFLSVAKFFAVESQNSSFSVNRTSHLTPRLGKR